jgi:molecular chaperone GrpE
MSVESLEPEEPASEDEAAAGENGLQEQLDEALKEEGQFRAMAQRAQADLVNYKKRVAEEIQETRRSATTGVLLRTLSVVDDLERALSLIPDEAVAPGWREGLDLVLKNLNALLEAEGVKRIDAVGQPFDPRESEAVMHEETADVEEGAVVRVFREGYKHRDRVLRAAQVVVAKAPPADTEEGEESVGETGGSTGSP